MRRHRFLFVLLAAIAFPAAALDTDIEYRVRPVVMDEGCVGFHVRMRLRGDADGSTEVLMPDAGRSSTHPQFRGERSVVSWGPQAYTIAARPKATLTLTYQVRPDVCGSDAFQGSGASVLARVQGRDDDTASLSLSPNDGWSIVPGGHLIMRAGDVFGRLLILKPSAR